MENLRKLNKYSLFLILVILLAAFLRFYQLGNIPAGLTNDEANTGHDAYSILLTGKDQWGTFLPITNFKGFGDFPPPVYRYLSVLPIHFFGLNQFSVRFISALAGTLSVLMLYFVGKKLFNKKIAIFSSILFAIMPWAIGLSRVAIESNVAILFLLIAIWFGFNNSRNKIRNFTISVISLAVSAYTYSAYSLFVPLVFIVLIFENFYKTKLSYKNIILPLVIFLILILPIFSDKGSASTRFSQIGFLSNENSIGLINILNDERGQCLKVFNSNLCRVINNKQALFLSVFVKNYLSHFSPNFLYINGTSTQYSILPQRGLDYLLSFVFLVLGMYFLLIKNKNKKLSVLFLTLFLLAVLPDSLTGDGNYSRASIMQPFLAIIGGLGLSMIYDKFKNKKVKYAVSILISIILLFSLSSFYFIYLTYFKNNYSTFSQYGYQQLMTQVAKNKDDYQRIYISKHLNDTKQYIYYLFFNKYDPRKYQSKKNVSYNQNPDGWFSIDRIENIYFVQNPPVVDDSLSLSKEKILIISNPVDFPKTLKPVFEIKDRLGNVLFEAINLSDLLKYNKEQQLLLLKKNV